MSRPGYVTKAKLKSFIKSSLREDVGDGDHTSLAAIPESHKSEAELIIKADGILAGIEVAREAWNLIDPNLNVDYFLEDGAEIQHGMRAFRISGNSRSILIGERLVLNIMQRMSGIATKTKKISDILYGTKAKVLDTRKTTPGFRMLEKWAVLIGGGANHRFGLYDQILLKDNHVELAGGTAKAIKNAKEYLRKNKLSLPIEVETRSIPEVKEALQEGGVDIIMLDNMMPSQMREAVKLIRGKCKVEASGGITETTILEVAETGVDYISVGALTHSYDSIDMSLKAV